MQNEKGKREGKFGHGRCRPGSAAFGLHFAFFILHFSFTLASP
jgi:hypothetical protein